jgi:hypothetical protein
MLIYLEQEIQDVLMYLEQEIQDVLMYLEQEVQCILNKKYTTYIHMKIA